METLRVQIKDIPLSKFDKIFIAYYCAVRNLTDTKQP